MLESIRDRAQGWLAKVILAVISVPFALWGVDSYLKYGGSGDAVAQVGDYKIGQSEFTRALKDRQQQLRNMLGKQFDPAMLDSPDVRKSVLDDLIGQQLLLSAAKDQHLTAPPSMLENLIASVPAFQENGQFSQARYEQVLRAQQMTPQYFQSRVRQDFVMQHLRSPFVEAAFLPNSVVDNLVRLGEQKREVSLAHVAPEQFLSQVKVDSGAAKAYYDKHSDEFRTPDQVRLEYVMLSASDLVAPGSVSEADIKRFYDEHLAQYQTPEERQASHILIMVSQTASEKEKAAAEAKAKSLAETVKKEPKRFAELAKQNSQDPGSAEKGGDLGYFTRGAMVKAFDDAVFQMSPGEIRGPVKSEFGYHIIQLTGVKPGKTRPLSEVHGEIAAEVAKQNAGKRFGELAETFNNTVYEQSDSLKPAAQALNLPIKTSGWLTSKGGEQAGLLDNPKLLQAVFSDQVLKEKRNTEAIEVAPNTLVAARIAEYKPAAVRPFADVEADLTRKLQREQAAQMAVTQGKAWLAELQQGKDVAGLKWDAAQEVSRGQPKGLNEAVLAQAYKADARKLPAYGGAEQAPGFTLVKVTRVITPADKEITPAMRKAYAQRFAQIQSQEAFSAYMANLRKDAEIKTNKERLDKVER